MNLLKHRRLILAIVTVIISWGYTLYWLDRAETSVSFGGSFVFLTGIIVFYSLVVISYQFLKAGKTTLWVLISGFCILLIAFQDISLTGCLLVPAISLMAIGYLQFLHK